jgi:hypothetical protein
MLNIPEADWYYLLDTIQKERCTPFLGAGASAGTFPLGSEIAKRWAKEYNYPMPDSYDLSRVAQFVAVTTAPMEPKDRIQQLFQAISLPDFTDPHEPHRILADLPFPIYMTTNYDNSMASALTMRYRYPSLEVCRWNTYLRENEKSIFDIDPNYIPTANNPFVFHLHGNLKKSESLVLTEDDYLDFLVSISNNSDLLPKYIRKAMFSNSILFMGYRIADWNFRVLFQSLLAKSLARGHIAVMMEPEYEGVSREQQENAQKYLENYYARLQIRVYWGTFQEFAAELRRRWVDFNNAI